MPAQKKSKMRVDQALVDRGLVESRSRAQAMVMAGLVYKGTRRVDKSSDTVVEDESLAIKGRDHPWVSRGGLKLVAGLDHFGFDPAGRTAIDIGASTGGFTDVLLSRGAAKVYAVDVGHGQLDWKLRNDQRVVVLEKTNARHLTAEQVPEPVHAIVCDASFISLKTVLPAALELAAEGAFACVLVKPQFEVGRNQVGKGGVVRDPNLHRRVCDDLTAWFAGQPGWKAVGVVASPIKGPEGNIEFLLGAQRQG